MSGPDVRWEGVPHKQILEWVNEGPGPKLTERMEAALKSAAETLAGNSDLVNTTLQRVNGGEWSGAAASTAAAAMQVLRDFDDTMHQRSVVSDITAFGQSDSANWARTNVPPEVPTGTAAVPLGDPGDVLRNTADYQDQQVARLEAERRARQVMQEYTTITVDRVRSMPPLLDAPQVVVEVAESEPGGGGAARPGPGGGLDGGGGLDAGGGLDSGGGLDAGGGLDGGGEASGPDAAGGAGGGGGNGRVGGEQGPPPTGGDSTTPALAPSAAAPRPPAGVAHVGSSPDPAGGAGLPVGAVVPLDAVAGPLGGARRGLGGELGGRAGEPGGRAGEPGGRAGGMTEPGARAAQQGTNPRGGASPAGVAPVGPPPSRDDRDRQSRYIVPSSAIFQPDEDAHVASPAIGAEDDE